MCGSCGHQTSVTAGTLFQDTRTSLVTWFRTVWWVVSQKNGASALGLQRVLGLGSYRTAWTWLHKLRRAMVRPGRDRLSGAVEVDETFVGGVEPGAVVITDGLQSYRVLPQLGYSHDRRVLLGSGESADAVLPRVHRVAALLKRWLMGTHQGAVSRQHLDYYLDEFTFRFNRRASRHRGKLFYRLLQQAVTLDPVPYRAIARGVRGPKKGRHHNRLGLLE